MTYELGPTRAMPAEEPLSMSRAPLHGQRQPAKERSCRRQRRLLVLSRSYVISVALGLEAYGCYEMYQVVSSVEPTGLQWLFLALFAINFLWISLTFGQASLGFLRIALGRARRARVQAPMEDRLPTRTAVLIPVYNEDPARIVATVRAISPHLDRAAPGKFVFFALSDSNNPDAWILEEAALRQLHREAPPGCPFYYRHRAQNSERKAGNLADWVQRWGGGYEAMVVLDADSVMAPETLLTLVRRLAADPGVGLIQTLPRLIRGRTLFARLQQFAGACYGPVHAFGLAGWYGASGNYWGHNAVIRVRAFAAACHLPVLAGKPPFGGHILSHDFAEAALMRRAGWGVEFHTDLHHSYEESPPSLLDGLVRDRRWCQGNLQHLRLVLARGLRLPSRLHLLTGAMAYLSAVLWLLLIVVGLALSVQAKVFQPAYFDGPSLFPHWPVFEAERALTLLTVSMAVLLGPKVLGWLCVLSSRAMRRRFGGALAVTASVIVETLLSALYAPIMMLSHSFAVVSILLGRDSGWNPQRRGGGAGSWRLHWRGFAVHTAAGLLAGGLAWHLSMDLFLWLLPFTTGLLLAPGLSWISGSARSGLGLARCRLLLIPEERRPPAIVRWFEARLEEGISVPSDVRGLERLVEDPPLRRWHIAQLPATETAADLLDVDHVLALAKADRSGGDVRKLSEWLSTGQTMALLGDRAFLSSMDGGEDPARFAGQNR